MSAFTDEVAQVTGWVGPWEHFGFDGDASNRAAGYDASMIASERPASFTRQITGDHRRSPG